MLTIKVQKIDTGYICECVGTTMKGEQHVSHIETLPEVIAHIQKAAGDFEAVQTEREAIAAVQSVLTDAQKRYKDAQDAGLNIHERVAAALNISDALIPPNLKSS